MAKYFSEDGWNDITIAVPINIRELPQINLLAEKIKVNILLDQLDTAKFLSDNVKQQIGIFLKIDVGYHRCGILPENISYIDQILTEFEKNKNIKFQGFLTHAGHTYHAINKEEKLNILKTSAQIMYKLKQMYIKQYPEIIISYGDTPSCSIAESFEGFDEIRPGNFVYYDVMQYYLRSCEIEDIAIAVACPVLSIYKERKQVVIYGGGIHLAKDSLQIEKDKNSFGLPVQIMDDGTWQIIKGANLISISQEVGVIDFSSEENIPEFVKVGQLIGILPIHSCMTVDMHKMALSTKGEKLNLINQ